MRADRNRPRIGVLASHPIQYQAPIFRALASMCELTVFFAHRQAPKAQADAGFGVPFEWDVDLYSGYDHVFLPNVSRRPGTDHFFGCDTPDIGRRVSEGRFDAFVVLGWHLKCFWQAVAACRGAHVPVMCRGDSQLQTHRPLPVRLAKELLYPWLLRCFDAHLYVGMRNREYLAHYGVPGSRLFFSPHCVDVDAFASAAKRAPAPEWRDEWAAAHAGAGVVLFAGKLVDRKRPQDVIEAARLLGSRGREVLVVFAGDGPMRGELAAKSRQCSVPAVFLGFCNQSELPAVYAAADALVLPSAASETWGLVVNEAMACGTPCIVSRSCGCAPDMVEGKGSGVVYACADVDGLAAGIESVLDDLPARRAALPPLNERYSPANAARGIVDAARALAFNEPKGAAAAAREQS